jgi:hypothetical protein
MILQRLEQFWLRLYSSTVILFGIKKHVKDTLKEFSWQPHTSNVVYLGKQSSIFVVILKSNRVVIKENRGLAD